MIQITKVELLGDYRLRLRFDDGIEGELDISEQIPFDGVFEPLKDLMFFRRVHLNRIWGTIEWPGGIDLDPEVLHEEITGKTVAWAKEELVGA